MTKISDEASRSSLFDEFERTDLSPKAHGEGAYSFLNRAKNSYFERLRNLLEQWFLEYPEDNAIDLASRFKSDNREQHFPAWWELYVYTLFDALGFQIEVHPELADSGNHPDFLATRDDLEFYLEAATFFSDIVDSSQSERAGWIYDAVNKLSNPNFFVGLEFEVFGTERPRITEVTSPLKNWLESLDPTTVEHDADTIEWPPVTVISVRDWRLRFSAYPIPPENRTEEGIHLEVYPMAVGMVKDREAAVRTLKKKRSKYGVLDKPYMIALLPWAPYFHQDDAVDALFGELRLSYIENGPVGQQAKWDRAHNGVWRKNPEQGSGISAVLIGGGSELWEPASKLPRLWLNPWARRPIDPENLPFPVTRLTNGGMLLHARSNESAHAVFGMSQDWSSQ
ncbi:hypothetical protein [Saccharopolyspora endophytica]|uniref:Uncharacterized protein n=1 Tax=Saccharopolyspora endophytica TaxID=543886 RepID=A0ABS5D8S8_9PSEU|nr:hypothetical protein [Saccharopolyspora endophytica]MBQ0922696.1 hypothetical protein [Saccharopolyspora endophytica]